jgi:2-methylisocitrate lyase-like PEP mutase family enzyme
MTDLNRRSAIKAAGVLLSGAAASAVAAPGVAASASQTAPRTPGEKFRHLLQTGPQQGVLISDALMAQISQDRGFPWVAVGGSSVAKAQFGFGDYGMLTISEQIEMTSRVCEAVDIPVLSDLVDIGSNLLSVARHVPLLERAGAGALMMDEFTGAKLIGKVGEGALLTKQAMIDKVKCAVDSRRDAATVLLARSDDPDRNRSFDRLHAYAEAGADCLYGRNVGYGDVAELARSTGKAVLIGNKGDPNSQSALRPTAEPAKPWVMTREYAQKIGATLILHTSLPRLITAAITEELDKIHFGGPAQPNNGRPDQYLEVAKKYNVFQY